MYIYNQKLVAVVYKTRSITCFESFELKKNFQILRFRFIKYEYLLVFYYSKLNICIGLLVAQSKTLVDQVVVSGKSDNIYSQAAIFCIHSLLMNLLVRF